MLWAGDVLGRRTRFNRRWLEFTGGTALGERGRGWQKHVPADDLRRYLRELRAAAGSRVPLRTSYRVARSDGTSGLVLEEARPQFNRRDRITGFVGVCLEADAPAPGRPAHADSDEPRSLSNRLVEIREEERSSLARELHDELGQLLTSTKLDLMWLCEQARQPDARPSVTLINRLQSLAGLVEVAIASVQRITADLRPAALDHMGLGAALEWEGTKFQARTGIRCRVDARIEGEPVDPARAVALFRIAQESLTNVARHARAGAVRLSLRRVNGQIVLEVRDNGRGITAQEMRAARSTGLHGMRDRARLLGGECRISGTPGRGTKVVVSIPVAAAGA